MYFFTTMGFSDFLLNTLLLRKAGWVEDKGLPGTLVTACIFPNALIAFVYLLGGKPLGAATLVLCVGAIMAGSFVGARVVTNLKGETIRRVMGAAMLCSIVALVLKMILSAGSVGRMTTLSRGGLCIALPVIFALGFINMFGIPMKPTATALFLLLGMEPMSALTLMMAMGIASPMSGGVRVVRGGNYHKKVVLAALSFGGVGALLGTAFTVTLDATLLSVILIVMMAVAAVSMLKK